MHQGWKSVPKSLSGQDFQEKLSVGVPPYFGIDCIFINKCFEIRLSGILYLPSSLPPKPTVCIYVYQFTSVYTVDAT